MKHIITLGFFIAVICTRLYAQYEDSVYYDDGTEYTTEEPSIALPLIDPAELTQTKNYTDEKINVKKFDQKKWQEVVGSTDYTNEKAKLKQKPKGGDSTQSNSDKGNKRYVDGDEEDEEEEENGMNFSFGGPIIALLIKLIFYGAILAIIGFIIYYLVKHTSLKAGNNNSKIGWSDLEAPVEDIASLDVDTLLERTLAAGNYRLAIRMYYLGLLKKLNENGFILWKKDKTNRDYLTELFLKAHHYEEVKKLTLAYEQVWYGDHTLPVEAYKQLMADFKAIDENLNTSKAQ